jgi:hypothetical protein
MTCKYKLVSQGCKPTGRQFDMETFYPEVHVFANTLVPVETSSKVAAGPLAISDPQVTLSHVECLPQALALDPTRPLVALRVSLY